MKSVETTGLFWIDVDHPAGLKEARRRVLRSLIKPQDGFVSRCINRPVSLRVTSLLADLPVTPNQVSFFTLVLASAGCFFFLRGMPILAGLLIHLNSVMDGVDGEMARLRRESTFFGGWWDRILDRVKEYLIFLALGVRSVQEGFGEAAWFWCMGLAFVATVYLVLESSVTASGLVLPERPPAWARALRKIQLRPENVMLLIALGMMLDAAYPLMILLSVLYTVALFGWVGGSFALSQSDHKD